MIRRRTSRKGKDLACKYRFMQEIISWKYGLCLPFFEAIDDPHEEIYYNHWMKSSGAGVRIGAWEGMMTHKYRGSIIVLSISKSVKPNEEQNEMTSGFQ